MNRIRTLLILGTLLAIVPGSAMPSRATEPTGRRWLDMHYGPYLTASVESPGHEERNLAYKGVLVRVGGDVTHAAGRKEDATLMFDTDLLRYAAGWTGGFLNMRCIAFDGSHGTHSSVKGDVAFTTPMNPGWARDRDGSFADPRKLPYGPLPRDWAHWKGLYLHEDQVILSYTVGDARVLELPAFERREDGRTFLRHLQIDGAKVPLVMQVADTSPSGLALYSRAGKKTDDPLASSSVVIVGKIPAPRPKKPKTAKAAPDVVDGLLARWSFDDSDGKTAKNAIGKQLVGIVRRAELSKGHSKGGLRFKSGGRVDIADGDKIDLGASDFSISAWIKTRGGGTILAKTGKEWERQGKTFFVRGGKLCFDIGWVGAVESQRSVNDNRWHHVTVTFVAKTKRIRLFVDGRADGERSFEKIASDVEGHVLRLGYTSPDFPDPTLFEGTLDDVRLYKRRISTGEVALLAGAPGPVADESEITVLATTGAPAKASWAIGGDGARLTLPPGADTSRMTISYWRGSSQKLTAHLGGLTLRKTVPMDLAALTKGGPARWPQKLETKGKIGSGDKVFAVDEIVAPLENPWNSWMRLGGFDFFESGTRAAVCTWMGDVFLVDGIDADLDKLTWHRVASGLFQPLGLKIVDGRIYVLGRDQITLLHDFNGDGEADFYENFNNDAQVTEHFHEFAMDLQTDAAGDFYYMKGGRHAKDAVVPQHGTLIKVSKDGTKSEILAKGFRAPNGLHVNDDGTFFTSDQEGHWTPMNRINLVRKGGFYGYNWSYFEDGKKRQSFDNPLCWIHKRYDRSPAAQLRVKSKKWGALDGQLLSFSYGTGEISQVLYEKIDDELQGGVMKLDVPMFPTGVMRGRFHGGDGQLYLCGLFGWSSNRTQSGGFYRVRHTGKKAHLPIGINATEKGMVLSFSEPLDSERSGVAARYAVERWNYRWQQSYGSKDYKVSDGKVGRDKVTVRAVRISKNGKSVLLEMEDMKPCMQMRIRYRIQATDGTRMSHEIYNSVNKVGPWATHAGKFE